MHRRDRLFFCRRARRPPSGWQANAPWAPRFYGERGSGKQPSRVRFHPIVYRRFSSAFATGRGLPEDEY